MSSVQDRLIGELEMAERILYRIKAGHSNIELESELKEMIGEIRWVLADLIHCEKK